MVKAGEGITVCENKWAEGEEAPHVAGNWLKHTIGPLFWHWMEEPRGEKSHAWMILGTSKVKEC